MSGGMTMANHWELNERQKLIDTRMKGAVNLYGCVTHRAFLTLFNRYNTPKLLKAELLKYANKLDKKSWMYYCIYENAIVNTTVPDEVIDEVIYRQQGKKYYIPTEEELLCRADEGFYEETPEVNSLYHYLCYTLKTSPLIADRFLVKLIRSLIADRRLHDLMTLLDEFHIELRDIDQANEMLGYILNLSNHTRMWSNCGFTPDEMFYNLKG
jgi:hypothetical protein